MDQEQQKKHRIGWFAIFVLIFLALVCDLLGLIPFVKSVLGTIFWICSSIYFWMIGMGIFNGRKLATMMISWVASFIPVIQEIPLELVVGIIVIIIMSRIEEKTGLSLTSMGKMANMHRLSRTPNQITPLNINGKRAPTGQNPPPLNKDGKRNPNQTTSDSEQAAEKQAAKNSAPDIDSLTADKERWESELHSLEPQLKALNDRYKEDSVSYLKLQMVVTEKQKQGASKEEVDGARKNASDFLASTRGQADQMQQMRQKVEVLKNQIWATNNKIIEEKVRVKGNKLA